MISENVDVRGPRYEDGYTLLMVAVLSGRREIVEVVLPHSNVLHKNAEGTTASDMASDYGNPELAEYIKAFVLSGGENKGLKDETPQAADYVSPEERAKPPRMPRGTGM